MNTAAYTEWKNDHKTSESTVFKHCQKAQTTIITTIIKLLHVLMNELILVINIDLTICTVTCFTATMKRLHAYYATLQYRSQSFISKSASHAYHKLNTCKILQDFSNIECT